MDFLKEFFETPPEDSMDRRLLFQRAAAAVAAMAATESAAAQEAAGGVTARLFPGFREERVQTTGAVIHTLRGGSGPPLLLLHGAPQTHVSWHKVAGEFAKTHTVVLTDLCGYGDSSKPADGQNHANYSKRAMAQDQVEVMKHFGFDSFPVIGHDRGGRVAHRMALDHPSAVTRLAVLDIVPTHKIYHSVTREFATAYYHWFFLIQPAPFPETLISNSVETYIRATDDASREYLRCFKDPANVHGMCEDYRAAASIDLEHDDADLGKKIACPLMALWAQNGPMGKLYDVLATWRERASNVTGKPLPGGHTLQMDVPEMVLSEVGVFLGA